MRVQALCIVVALAVAGAARAQCTKDTDCKGERICESGSCVNPDRAGPAAAPPASPQVAPAAAPTRDPADKILMTTDANMMKGIEAVGGKLILTGRKIIFSSHKLNIQKVEQRILLSQIVRVEKFGLIPNGLKVHTRDGRSYEFRVDDRDRLATLIDQHR